MNWMELVVVCGICMMLVWLSAVIRVPPAYSPRRRHMDMRLLSTDYLRVWPWVGEDRREGKDA